MQISAGEHYLSELKLDAVTMTSSLFWTSTGIFLQPGDFKIFCRSFKVSEKCTTLISTAYTSVIYSQEITKS